MIYPTISEYVQAIKSAEDNFDQLKNLRPVLDDDGMPVMSGGNFAVVFKMKDEQTGKLHAVKCFTKEQEGRAEAYREITKELEKVLSPYLTSVRYFDNELFVDSNQTSETEFPVLLMDWVEGKTLDKYLLENLDDKYVLEMLAYRFSLLAQWLIPQPFAHGDLKPDNILVREDGTLILVDYDGMYVPAMKGQKARELGSPDFRHPQRTIDVFDEQIDDFSLIAILLSLKAISLNPSLIYKYGAKDRLLFSQKDYITEQWRNVIEDCKFYNDKYLISLAGLFAGLCKYPYKITLPQMSYPYKLADYIAQGFKASELIATSTFETQTMDLDTRSPTYTIDQILSGLSDLESFLRTNEIDFILSGSLGLFLQGFVPPSYVPHDIDIRIRAQSQSYTKICEFFTIVSDYSMGKKNFVDEYPELMFPFYIKRNMIKINAFVLHEQYSPEENFNIISINNCRIKVHEVLEILQEKYALRREKDFLFNNHMQMTMNSYFVKN